MVHGMPGRSPETAKREQFAGLIALGVGNGEACRIVGVNRRTGTRWRYGRSITSRSGRQLDYPPVVINRKQEISDRYLCEDERVLIADRRACGDSVRSIATKLGRSPSTVSRELLRNRDPGRSEYRPFAAERLATARRSRTRQGKLAKDKVLREFVQDGLTKRWSPEQICHEIRREFPDDHDRHVVHETIYQAIYRPDLGDLKRDLLPGVLRTGRKRRRPRRLPDARRAGNLVNMTMIDQRPAEADDRSVPGHWEGDLITGAANGSAIGTLVERSSRLVILLHLPGRHTAEAVRDALVEGMSKVPAHRRRSLTWDQGREMALHGEIAQALGMPVFFCEKSSPWQRPSNENTNGLLRQYFPKGTDLRAHNADELAAVAAELNGRPRKTLDWDTPAQRFNASTPECPTNI